MSDLPAAICIKCSADVPEGARFCPECGFSRATRQGDPLIGQVLLGQFQILRRIGRGGWANVYEADQRAMARSVAVKVLHREYAGEAEPVQRFYREARAASKLNHPNILRPWMVGELDDGTPFLVMDIVKGPTLGDELKTVGKMSVERVLRVGVQISSGLEEAADQGIVHRDLKPANIFLTTEGRRDDVVKLADFGIAKVMGEGEDAAANLTRTGDILGTPAYMSPEQALGKPVDHRSDLYALGALLYRMVTGQVPFKEATLMALLAAQVSKSAPAISSIVPEVQLPQGFEKLVRTLMAKNREDRPSHASEVTQELLRMGLRAGFDTVHDPLAGTERAAPAPPPRPAAPAPSPAAAPDDDDEPETPITGLDTAQTSDPPPQSGPRAGQQLEATKQVPLLRDEDMTTDDAWEEPSVPPSHGMPAVGREWPTIHRKGGGEVVLGSLPDLEAAAVKVREAGGPMPLAGSGDAGHAGDDGPAVKAELCEPIAVAQDVHGNLFIVERGNHCVRFIDVREGIIRTVAGVAEESGFGGDDGPADIALLHEPSDLVADSMGNLYVADTGNRRVRAIDVRSGHIGTVIGSGRATAAMEGAPAHLAGLVPHALAIAPDGALFVADADNHRVWRVDPHDGTIRTAAGTGDAGDEGDSLNSPRDIAFSPDGSLYIADTGNARVCRIHPQTGALEVVAGGDDGSLGTPVAVTTTRQGALRVADSTGGRVFALDLTDGKMGAPYVVATDLAEPRGLMVDGQGTLYIADTARHRVWAVIEPK